MSHIFCTVVEFCLICVVQIHKTECQEDYSNFVKWYISCDLKLNIANAQLYHLVTLIILNISITQLMVQ